MRRETDEAFRTMADFFVQTAGRQAASGEA